jgi:protein-tyrosine phosphatase
VLREAHAFARAQRDISSAASTRETNLMATRAVTSKKMLFLCTGNYYRSRFAEMLFNHLAARAAIGWQAISRGLALELGAHNVGPIATATLAGLVARGVRLEGLQRGPLALAEEDLISADHIVALKRDEHYPLMARNFPRWIERVEYWHVHDVDFALPDETLSNIDRDVRGLIQRLRGDGLSPRRGHSLR